MELFMLFPTHFVCVFYAHLGGREQEEERGRGKEEGYFQLLGG